VAALVNNVVMLVVAVPRLALIVLMLVLAAVTLARTPATAALAADIFALIAVSKL